MAAYLHYGSYTHPVVPSVRIARQTIRHPGTDAPIGSRETWTISGFLTGEDQAALKAARDALVTAYATDGQDLKLTADEAGTQVLDLLDSSASAEGVKVTARPHFPESERAQWASNRRYDITVEAEFYDSDPDVLFQDYTTSYRTEQNGKQVRTRSGRLETKDGVSAVGHLPDVTPALPGALWQRVDETYAPNYDDTELTFSFTDRELWLAWPSNVTDGQVLRREFEDVNRRKIIEISGWFEGTDRTAAARAQKLSYPALSEEETTDRYNGRLSFRYSYLGGHRNVIDFEESVTMSPSLTHFELYPVLDGRPPVKQTGGKLPASLTQSGSATGRTSYPPIPEPILGWDSVKSAPQVKRAPRRGPNGQYAEYRVSWTYQFELPTTPAAAPRKPK